MADQVLMPNQTISMGILKMDFERILGVPFFIVVLTTSFCERHLIFCPEFSKNLRRVLLLSENTFLKNSDDILPIKHDKCFHFFIDKSR